MTLAGREKEKEQIPGSVIRPLALSDYATSSFPAESTAVRRIEFEMIIDII